MDPMFLKVQ